jgi:hypothetical protein
MTEFLEVDLGYYSSFFDGRSEILTRQGKDPSRRCERSGRCRRWGIGKMQVKSALTWPFPGTGHFLCWWWWQGSDRATILDVLTPERGSEQTQKKQKGYNDKRKEEERKN